MIKEKKDIGQVIGQYIKLTRTGHKLTGLCPFHDDHHPSLQVNLQRQSFICYACGAKGDVISFVQQIERCSFREALEKLSPFGKSEQRKVESEKLIKETRAPIVNLPDHSVLLPLLMPYYSGVTDLTGAYLEFEVGVAPHLLPNPWKALAGRLIFPIRNSEGQLVGFSGRKAENAPAHLPKYLNTSAADGYQRNEHLYGFFKAREAIRKAGRVYVTEGCKDTIAMHAAGFKNTVGLCGKDLSLRQQQLIAGETRQVCLLLDGDTPGREGAARLTSQLEQTGMEVIRINLPEGHDPDSLFRQLGKKAFEEYIFQQTFPPCQAEEELIAGCLQWPDAILEIEERSHLFVELLPGILEKDKFSLASSLHKEILSNMTNHVPAEQWKESVSRQAADLQKKYAKEGDDSLTPGQKGELMKKRLMRYGEHLLIDQLNDLFRQLHDKKEEERNCLLQQIRDRQQLLNRISRTLLRTDALHEQWF